MEPLLVQREENPVESNATAVFAYFKDTPTATDLQQAQEQHCEGCGGRFDSPTAEPNVVSKRANVERWCLWY